MGNTKLSDCVYQHIKDTFYYGIFDNFKIVVDKSSGYFNASKLCELVGKIYEDWCNLDTSKTILDYYSNRDESCMYEIQSNAKDKLSEQIKGIYLPPEILVNILSWVSTDFYDRCNNIIIDALIEQYKSMTLKSLGKKIKEVEEQIENITFKNQEYLLNILKQRKSDVSQ
jgi:hypothetical protein